MNIIKVVTKQMLESCIHINYEQVNKSSNLEYTYNNPSIFPVSLQEKQYKKSLPSKELYHGDIFFFKIVLTS